MTRPRLVALIVSAVAAGAAYLYGLGRCEAWHMTEAGVLRCVHDIDHLHDHEDRHGATWDDDRLRQRRAITGILLANGAKPAVPA